jgi:tetratricopeptide (TPR) repeat protein/predicted Ser/Thr protein kinase
METEDWRRAFSIAEAILDQPERQLDLLDESCRDDPKLRAAVARLLEHSLRTAGFLDQSLCRLEGEATAFEPPPSDDTGRQVGPYRILRELGRGGMGAVYLAERADGEYRRQAALKILKRGLDADDVIRRFRTERQILATLAHPNIAELYDGGTTDDDQPYFVMEYVDGVPIDEYCDRHNLSTPRRLELFLQVCAAVQHAHESFVVHRDIKPSNILVTTAGRPKLLDFGIAKLLHADTSSSVARTESGVRPMTPDYASPEQVLGQPIAAASDVYSLGVLLYKLLSGHRPYQLKTHTEAELRRVICEEDPLKPSLRAGPRRLSRDLDDVTLKAMHKQRERRYSSVDELAHDVRRHLDGRPVRARDGTLSYRLSKFVRRRAGSLAAATAVITALLGVGAREHQLRHEASRERDKAQEVALFLKGLLEQSDPNTAPGGLTVRQVLDEGARRIDVLGHRPELQAVYLETIGGSYRSLGLYDQALPMLERALATRRALYGEAHVEVAESLDDVGEAHYYRGDLESAETHYRQALAMRRRLLGNDHPDVAESASNLGVLLTDKEDYAAAEPLLREALGLYRRHGGDRSAQTASSLNNLAVLLHDRGALEEAERMYREAAEVWRAIHGRSHPQVATALNNVAVVLLDREAYAEAERYYREALDMRRQLYQPDHPELLQSINALGVVLYWRGDHASAAPLFATAVESRRRVLGPDNMATAMSELNLARVHLEGGAVARAEALARTALATLQKKLPETGSWQVGLAEVVLGASLGAQGHREAAEALLVRGHAALKVKRGARAAVTREAARRLLEYYDKSGQPDRARAFRSAESAPF